MPQYLDELIFGIRDIVDKLGTKLPTRTALQFLGAVTVEDDPETKRTIVRVEGGGGGGGDVELDGEVTGPASATVVAKVGGAAVAFDDTETGYLAVEDGEIVAKSPPTPDASAVAFDPSGTGLSATDVQGAIVEASGILATVEIPLPTASSPHDELIYTVPACVDATITFVLLSVEEQLQGAGTVTVRVGTTAGDDDLIIDQVIDSTTQKGNFAGKDISTLGAAWPASSGYVLDVKENDEIHVQVTTNGTVDSGKIRVTVVGVIVR